MSILSVATIQSANSTTDLTIRASNSSGSQIILYSNGEISLQTLNTIDVVTLGSNSGNIVSLSSNSANITTLSSNSGSITTLSSNTANITTLTATTANVSNLTVSVLYANGSVGTDGQFLQSNGTTVSWAAIPPSAAPYFNTNISEQVGFAVTDTLSAAFTAPSTADRRYIIHSIHATNISSNYNDLYVEIEGTEYANTSIAGNIPLPVGTSIEILKRPKILYPNDKIKARATASSSIHLLIVYEVSTDTNLFGKGYNVVAGNTTFDAFTATGNSVIESIQLTNYNPNTSALAIDATVRTVWVNASNVVQGYFTYDLLVPNKATIDALDAPKVLPSGHKIQVQANQTDYIDVVVSGKLI